MLAGAFSWRHLKTHCSDEYIVPEASDGDVTDTACPGRILLVEQQVSLPLLLIKTETDIQATFTSHQARFQKGHTRVLRSDAITTNWVIYFSLTSPVIRFLETVFGLQVVRQSQSAAALPVSERSFLFTRKNLRSCLISGSRTG